MFNHSSESVPYILYTQKTSNRRNRKFEILSLDSVSSLIQSSENWMRKFVERKEYYLSSENQVSSHSQSLLQSCCCCKQVLPFSPLMSSDSEDWFHSWLLAVGCVLSFSSVSSMFWLFDTPELTTLRCHWTATTSTSDDGKETTAQEENSERKFMKVFSVFNFFFLIVSMSISRW